MLTKSKRHLSNQIKIGSILKKKRMETYTQYIELINDYLNNILSKEAQADFESKLKSDTAFNTIYQEHLVFVNGLERIEIKDDIQNAKQSYHTEKWLKISGISILVIGALVMLYTLVFNTSEMEPTPNVDTLNTIIIDSTSNSKTTNFSNAEPQVDSVVKTKTTKGILVAATPISEEKLIAKANYNPFQKAHQTLRVNTQNDTIITCKEGTILRILKGSFVNPKTGKSIVGNVDIKVTEYYKLSDILIANLSTVSNGQQLETGGMLFIEATQGAIDLKLKDSSPIDISFPTTSKKEGMQLFTGEWTNENMNWSLQNDQILEEIDIIEEHVDVPFNVVEVVPTFPGCETKNTNDARKKCMKEAIASFVNRKFNVGLANNLGLSGLQRINCYFKIDTDGNVVFIQSRAPHPRLSEEADRVIGLLPKMIPGKQRGKAVTVPYALPIRFKIQGESSTNQSSRRVSMDTISTVTSIAFDQEPALSPVEMDTTYNANRGMVEFIREVMHDKDFPVDSLFISEWEQYKKQKLIRSISIETKPNYIERAIVLRKPLLEMEGSKFKIIEGDSITRGGHIIRVPWDESKIPTTTQVMTIAPKRRFSAGTDAVTAEEFESRIVDVTDRTVSSRDAGYYILKTSNLGWINCDRFINGRTTRIKYKLKIKNADGASISMVFKSINAVLPSWYTNGVYDFQTVGANENVVLVAIKRKNGKLYYDMVETKTKANPQLDFKFKEVTIEELKKELEGLNSNFN